METSALRRFLKQNYARAEFYDTQKAVSYTHLDGYKRQIKNLLVNYLGMSTYSGTAKVWASGMYSPTATRGT